MKYLKIVSVIIISIFRLCMFWILGNRIHIKLSFIISSDRVLKTSRKGLIKIGKLVYLYRDVEISANGGKITLKGCNFINKNTMIVSHNSIFIGYGTTIGPHTLIYDHDHNLNKEEVSDTPFVAAPIIIGRNVWIGAGVIILKGVKIGDNSVIATGTVVNSSIEENMIVYQKRQLCISKEK